ncbi:Zn-ribbon domain-containing OB-fold protein [Rhodococcus artemisiae]|uniref:OB-fold domain-containing protein n=1 Tax=Rhodococcus artemisiae TaxID=714159 RepID=A0ABU7LC61_9NOCA|nr:OB-fold domain-containing protein [Rhodococcus artemisiae]MEE2059138.1 OB-fold domain-containing protein [Rhodococcus artemisiae]
MSQDTQFFWDGAREHRLLIQRCTGCGVLRHPPGPLCPSCHGFDWETVRASGRGTVTSFVVQHHPPAPGFEGPAPIVLVELEEGVRLVSNFDGAITDLGIGALVEVFFLDQEEGWTLPQFRRVPGSVSSGPGT